MGQTFLTSQEPSETSEIYQGRQGLHVFFMSNNISSSNYQSVCSS